MRKSSLPVTVLIACILVASGCGETRSQSAGPSPSPLTTAPQRGAADSTAAVTPSIAPAARDVVRVSHTQGLAGALQIAKSSGYFQEQGIDLQEVGFGSSAEALLPMSTGELDAGSVSPNVSFYNALNRGIRIYLALGASQAEPWAHSYPLMVRLGPNGPEIRDVAALRGKRIAQNQHGMITEWARDRMLADVGLRPDEVETVLMSYADALAAFAGGTIDASVMPEPFGTISEERGLAVRLREVGEYIPGAQAAVIGFSERFAHQRPEVARRWAVAYLLGVRDFMDAMEYGRNREAVIGLLAQASGFEPRLIDKAGYFPVRRDGRVNVVALQEMLDWLIQSGYLSQKPDLAPLLDSQFADYARETLERSR